MMKMHDYLFGQYNMITKRSVTSWNGIKEWKTLYSRLSSNQIIPRKPSKADVWKVYLMFVMSFQLEEVSSTD